VIISSAGTAAASVAWQEHTIDADFDAPFSLFSADVDGDGDQDVLGASSFDDEITWWENAVGDGSVWTERIVNGAFDFAYWVSASDVDGDGDIDVLGASSSDNEISWWVNRAGDGTVWMEQMVDTDYSSAASVSAGDVDGDGDMDLFGTSRGLDDVTWWENVVGDGTLWTEHTIDESFDEPRQAFGADVDGDGDLDVMAVAGVDNEIAWWENVAGDGSTWSEHTIDGDVTFPRAVVAGDMDGDGDVDVLGAVFIDGDVTWWENANGDGLVWVEHTIDSDYDQANTVYAADVDGDGDLDALAMGLAPDVVTWWENTSGDGTAWTEHTIDESFDGAFFVIATDVDGDGDTDVVGGGRSAVTWWENQTIHRSATFPTEVEIASPSNEAHDVIAVDLDEDGDMDTLVASGADNTIAWYESDGGMPPTFTERVISNTVEGAQSVFAVNVNGDARIDVLSASSVDDSIRVFSNVGGDPPAFVEQVISSSAMGAVAVLGADLDADGDVDVLSASREDDRIRWFDNDGNQPPSFTERFVTTTADSVRSVFVSDLDDDGDLDVLAASRNDNKAAWHENDGGSPPVFTERIITDTAVGARSIHAVDMDADGRTDVIVGSELDDSVRLFTNQGGRPLVFLESIVSSTVDGVLRVSTSDVDVDGDPDILAASRDDDTLRWFENNGNSPPTFTEHVIATDATFAQSIVGADLDGDGDPDTLASTLLAYKVAWYENCGGQFGLETTDTAPSELLEGTQDDLLAIEVVHNGRGEDSGLGLLTLELLFEESAGITLSTEEANAVIEALQIYLDDGSGTFEAANDLLVGQEFFITLVDGRYTFDAGSGNLDFQVPTQGSATYFVAVELTEDARSQSPNQFRVTHLTSRQSVFVESGGRVVFEAERFSSRTAGPNHEWLVVPEEAPGDPFEFANYRGEGYAQILPELGLGGVPLEPPFADYTVGITTAGEYQLHVRWDGSSSVNDSLYASIVELKDGDGGSVADWYRYSRDQLSPDGDFATSPWQGEAGFELTNVAGGDVDAVWNIDTPGVYTIRLDLREDGAAVDALVFQLSSLSAPVGDGPPESQQVTTDSGPQSAAEGADFSLPLSLECVDSVSSSVVAASSQSLTLEITGVCPDFGVVLTGAEPNANITILASDAEGSFVKPQPPCEGLDLGLETPGLVTTVMANANGNLLLTPNVGGDVCGRFVQAVETATCSVSNVAELQ